VRGWAAGGDGGAPLRLPGAVRHASISERRAPSLRRISAASSAAAMISLVPIWSAAGPMEPSAVGLRPDHRLRGRSGKDAGKQFGRLGRASYLGRGPSIRPTSRYRSASVTSNPASDRPAMTPITTRCLPIRRTEDQRSSPAARARLAIGGRRRGEVRIEEGVVFTESPFRDWLPALPVATTSVAAIVDCGDTMATLRSWVSPLPMDHDRRNAKRRRACATEWCPDNSLPMPRWPGRLV